MRVLAGGHDRRPPPGAREDVCAGYAFGGSTGARVFAIQPKIAPEQLETYEAFRGHLARLVDEKVGPCLAGGRANIIAFPEDVGLEAVFIGSRGKKARAEKSALSAFL